MKNILSISDSYEGTHLDVKRSIATIKGYEMEPFIAVSEFIHSDGSVDPAPIKETLEFCFNEGKPDAVFVGFMRNASQARTVARELARRQPAIVVSDPSIISDTGEIWMSEETYNVISTSIFDLSSHIIINHLETELLAGFECRLLSDFERAAKKLSMCFDAVIYIKGCDLTFGRALVCSGIDVNWIEEDRKRFKPELSFGNALNCELALGNTGLKAITNAQYFALNGRRVIENVHSRLATPSLISPAKSLRDIARSIDSDSAAVTASAKPAKMSIIDPVTEGTKGTVSDLTAPETKSPLGASNSLTELANMRKRLEALKHNAE